MSDRSTLLLEHHLKELKLPSFLRGIRQAGRPVCRRGRRPSPVLAPVGRTELIDRHQRMVQRRIRAARFPAVKSLDTFDFLAIPSVNKSPGDGAGPLRIRPA